MTAHYRLSGSSILVAEDDFYLADETREALEAAGAIVLGPCPTADEALALLRYSAPDGAVLDVSLADGSSFDLARAVIGRGIKMLFVTGYGASAIPADLAHVPRLQKPLPSHRIVKALVGLTRPDEAGDGPGV